MLVKIGRLAVTAIAPAMLFRPMRWFFLSLERVVAVSDGRGGGSGWYDESVARALARMLPGAKVVVDVGSNNGEWIKQVSKLIGSPNVHMFECAPYCFVQLEALASEMPNARLNKLAVSDTEGEATLHVPTVGSGLASLFERNDTSVTSHDWTELQVKTITLDNYFDDQGITHVDLLKIDVEGAELGVLRGARKSFESGRIGAVVFEFGSSNVNSRTFFRDFWFFSAEHGYSLERFIPGGYTVPVEQYSDRLEYFVGPSNYLARRNEKKRAPQVQGG